MKRKRKYRASECVGCGEVISHERFHTYGYCAECFQRGLVPLGVIRESIRRVESGEIKTIPMVVYKRILALLEGEA